MCTLSYPYLLGDGVGRHGVVPRHHHHADAGVLTYFDGVGNSCLGRVSDAEQPQESLEKSNDGTTAPRGTKGKTGKSAHLSSARELKRAKMHTTS